MHCPNCGNENADQTKYCRACGKRGISEGKLVTTAEHRSALLKLDETSADQHLVAIYGRH